jgi:hypothetical protein
MTRSKSAAAAAFAADASFLKRNSVKRITKESTCIILGITKESIRCTGCKNLYEKSLKSRIKSASIDSRHYKCDKPWILKGKITEKSIQIYDNAWKELEDELGYPNPKLLIHNDIQKRKADHPKKKTSVDSEISQRKKQKLTMPPSDQDVEEAYNSRCSTPTFFGSSSVASSPSQPPPVKVISTNCEDTYTPSTMSPHSSNSNHLLFTKTDAPVQKKSTTSFDVDTLLSDLTSSDDISSNKQPAGHQLLFNILTQNKRLENIITGLSSQNILLSSQLELLASSAAASESEVVLEEEEDVVDAAEFNNNEEEEQEEDGGAVALGFGPVIAAEQVHNNEEEKEQEEQDEEQAQQEAAAISNYDFVTNHSHHRQYKNGHMKFKRVVKQATGRDNYHGTPLGKKLYAHAAALSPQNSFKNLEVILALNQAAFLVDSGVGFKNKDLEKLSNTVPSATTLKDFVINAATDSAFQAWEEIVQDQSKLFLLCDKGAKKTANAHFVKILCWWSKLDKKIKTFNMDSNDTDGTSKACAHAIQHALSQLFGGQDNILAILVGQATDSGGGGTGNSFHKELTKLGLSSAVESYLKSFCTLHCIQLTLQNPINRVLGQGGMGKDGKYKTNAMQALHGLHNLQKYHERTEWPILWSKAAAKCGFDITNDEFSAHRIPAPILTRWWTVGECAAYLLKHITIILAICHGVIQASATAHAVNQVASGLEALLKTPAIVSDISLIDAFHKYFLCSHFAWLQKGDPELGNKPGFINRHIAVRYFLMHEELSNAYNMEGWKTMDAFEEFRDSMEDMDQESKTKHTLKCSLFLMIARRALIKHFKVWMNDLLFLAIYAEAPTGRIVAKYLSAPPNTTAAVTPEDPNEMQIFQSPIHNNRPIDLKKFASFISKQCKIQMLLRDGPHVFPQRLPIQHFANSVLDMWDNGAPLVLGRLKQNYLANYAALPSNTHLAESNVKDANLCQIKNRNENLSSTFSTARSGIVESLNENTINAFHDKERIMKGSSIVTGGVYGSRKYKKDGSDYIEKESKTRVDGKLRSQEAIQLVVKKHIHMEAKLTLPINQAKWDELKEYISQKINQFEEHRVAVKTEAYEMHYEDTVAPNVLQRRVGRVELMPLLEGLVTYSMLLKDRDIEQVKNELRFRELSDEGGWKKQLLVRLKKDEMDRGSRDKENFRPLNPDADFRAAMEGEIDEDDLPDEGEEEEQDW